MQHFIKELLSWLAALLPLIVGGFFLYASVVHQGKQSEREWEDAKKSKLTRDMIDKPPRI